jgi:hypothetical protein
MLKYDKYCAEIGQNILIQLCESLISNCVVQKWIELKKLVKTREIQKHYQNN